MSLPGEELVSTAIETLSEGLIKKMDEAEANRDREFAYRLKELEFYKTNYDKELRDVFDYWFELVRVSHIMGNTNLTAQEKERYQRKHKELIGIDKISKYKMNTLKYGGVETSRALAIENVLHQEKYSDKPEFVSLYMFCAILAVLKKDILGQELDPANVIRVLVNDYDENEAAISDAKKYIAKVYKKTYGEAPHWA